MKHITKMIGCIITGCLFVSGLYSCNGNVSDSYTRCEDSLAMYTKPVTTVRDTANSNATANSNDTANANANNNGKEPGEAAYHSDREMKIKKTKYYFANAKSYPANTIEPTGPMTLKVTSTAFDNMGTIPVKYTCDGQGATPPLTVTNIPSGSQSLALIVHDYHADPQGGFTFWIIWNLDTYGIIPEDFHNNHESMNAADQYGNTPLCSRSGNHKYHFIVYALDCKLAIGKNTTKASIEKVMKGHILAKGELVGVYNKQLE